MSPYSGYNGQLLTSVYQPTEMALMHKGTVRAAPVPSPWRPAFTELINNRWLGWGQIKVYRVHLIFISGWDAQCCSVGCWVWIPSLLNFPRSIFSLLHSPVPLQSEGPYDVILPRATAASSASSTLRAEDAFAVQARHAAAQRDARGSQVG